MSRSRDYFTLLAADEEGLWTIQFGDYDKKVVEAERDDYPAPKSQTKIIKTGARQNDIVAAVAKLNKEIA